MSHPSDREAARHGGEWRGTSYLADTERGDRNYDEATGPPNPHRGEDFAAKFERARALAAGTRKP